MKDRLIIGIDPGVKTGIAVWSETQKDFILITTTTIDGAMDMVLWHNDTADVFVRFEDARLRKWYGSNARAKMQGAGSVKRDCTIWEGFLKRHNIPFEAIDPKCTTTKMRAGYFKLLTGWEGRTSEHSRDAALLVYQSNGNKQLK